MLTDDDALVEQELARIILQWDRNREVMNVRPDAKARWIAQQASVLSQSIRTTDAARIAELEAALKPFAEMANWLDDTEKRRDAIYCGGSPGLRCEITQRDYHRARATLRSNPDAV